MTAKRCDTLVVGAGVIGLFAARALRRTGRRVVVLDAGRVGAQASRAGGGILSPLKPWAEPAAVQALARDSQMRYPAIARSLLASTGIDIEYRRTGALFVDADEARAMGQWAGEQGVEAQHWPGDLAAAKEPAVGARDVLAVPGLAQVRNPRLIDALRAELLASGVTLHERCAALGLRSKRQTIQGVLTNQGRFDTPEVVVASGAWSGQLLASTGWTQEVRPVRGQMLWFQPFDGAPSHTILGRDVYVIPRQDGVCLVGSTVEEVGFDASTTTLAAAELHRAAATLVPALARQRPAGQWAGLRPAVATTTPFVGAIGSCHGLFASVGHFRNGITLAPASAVKLLRSMDESPVNN